MLQGPVGRTQGGRGWRGARRWAGEGRCVLLRSRLAGSSRAPASFGPAPAPGVVHQHSKQDSLSQVGALRQAVQPLPELGNGVWPLHRALRCSKIAGLGKERRVSGTGQEGD